MEELLHYVWQHKLLPLRPLLTESGDPVEVIDPGLHNQDAGPDFFNAKVRIGGTLWVGNVEIHLAASDWFKHEHQDNVQYDNVILHVVACADSEVHTLSGNKIPQLVLPIPEQVKSNYRMLQEEAAYPPCYRIIPEVDTFITHSWMSALTTERMEQKMHRIENYLKQTNGDWERTYFITLARNFGFGTNSEAFEEWAFHIPPQTIVKHRDDLFQVEAAFMGQAGLLDDEMVAEEKRDDYFLALQKEYRFLAHKFNLTPMNAARWRFLRMRPQNFPHVRLAQLAHLYHLGRTGLSMMLETACYDDFRKLYSIGVTPYWKKHYTFGEEGKSGNKTLQAASVNLLIINTAAPILFAHGKQHLCDESCEKALELLEQTKAEQNWITRSWEKAGLKVEHAADSQALIQLKRNYCERKDCLKCRFGMEYMRKCRQE